MRCRSVRNVVFASLSMHIVEFAVASSNRCRLATFVRLLHFPLKVGDVCVSILIRQIPEESVV